jgi:8-oxo-dGTP pyrophosphatase MutT (NUDIX family)
MKKEYCPGYLDLVFGGVVGSGEENKVNECAARELTEELGLDLNELNNKYHDLDLKLNYLGKTCYNNGVNMVWSYVYVIFMPSRIENEIKFSDGEVEAVYWLSENEIVGKIKKDEKITPDSVDCFYYYLNNYKNN